MSWRDNDPYAAESVRKGGGPDWKGELRWRPAAVPVRALDLLLIVLFTGCVLLLIRFLTADPAITPEYIAGMLFLQGLVPLAAVYLVMVRVRGTSWHELGLRPISRRWGVWAALIALLSIPLVGLVNHAVQILMDEPFHNPQVAVLAQAAITVPAIIATFAVVSILVPFVEELVFRGLLYGWIRKRLNVPAGVLLSAIVFSLAHGIIILVPALVVQGIVLALLYEYSRSLWPPIVFHATFNAAMTAALYVAIATDSL